ncbi:MAG: queuosine precursor transporter [Treponema sp.]|nr:queuosine precursor transporter [Treponema sp.]MCL2237463.1 queuosine precursor transporter [Treponema sp.]
MNNPLSQPASYKYLDIVASFFVGILIVSNIASSAKIADTGMTIFGIPLVFDGGTILFPLVYVLGDVLTEVYGFKTARRVIWTGFAAMALTTLVFFVLGKLPAEAYWEETAGTDAYNAILGGMSYGGIVLASLSAYLAGEFTNAAILSKLKVMMKGRKLWVRTIGSSLVGQLLDTMIFVFIATLTGVFEWAIFWSLVLTNYILKCGIEALVTPFTYWASRFLKRKEGIDVYDNV